MRTEKRKQKKILTRIILITILSTIVFMNILYSFKEKQYNGKYIKYNISAGETLWSISKNVDFELYKTKDINFVIYIIKNVDNNIDTLQEGQTILIREVK